MTNPAHPLTPVDPRPVSPVDRAVATLARTGWAAVVYGVLAVITTWPVARHLGTRIAADLGDPLFNAWVLSWTTGQILQALSGNVSALGSYWDANIFHPEPLTLAYSEHLFGQTLLVLPIQALTGNVLLSYNLLFIATFALSGLAVHVLTRDLTGRPLAILGFRRYFVRAAAGVSGLARGRALAGGAAAVAMQNLSNGYFLLFFAPFAAAYCLYEIVQRRLIARVRVWAELAVAAAGVGLVTWPFLSAYLRLREISDLGERSMRDLISFSADTYAFATITNATRLLGSWLPRYPKPEGEGFPGFVILGLAIVGATWGLRRLAATIPWRAIGRWHRAALVASAGLCCGSTLVLLWFAIHDHVSLTVGPWSVAAYDATPVAAVWLASLVVGVALSSAARRAAPPSETAVGFFMLATLAAAILALGPQVDVRGQTISPAPYLLLYEYVPGFDGLRVPARMLMLVSLFMAVLAGLGAARVAARGTRAAVVVLVLAMGGILAEAWIAPVPMNAGGPPRQGLVRPPPPAVGDGMPRIYEFIRQHPGPMALLELPFDEPAYEMLAVFYAGYHRKPIVNGYSGMFPPGYRRTASALRDVAANPDRAIRTLGRVEATHVLVHEGAWPSDYGRQVSAWLVALGAKLVAQSDSDRLFLLPPLP